MDLTQNNPYRIAGILSNASAKELQRQKAKILAHARVGKEVQTEYDFDFLEPVSRINIEFVEKAFSNIEQNQDKVHHALFWFLNASPFDNTAIYYLKNGDNGKAIEIWEKVTFNKEVNSKNFSAFNNLSTFKLLGQSDDDIKEGIEAKVKLLESDYFENFVHAVADETYTLDNHKQITKLVDTVIDKINGEYTSIQIIQLFNNTQESTKKYLLDKLTSEPIHSIEIRIEVTKSERKKDKAKAYGLGLILYNKSVDQLSLLKSLLGNQDLKYKMIADNLAKEIMQCGIDYFKEWQDTKNPSNEGLELLKYAKKIAVGSQTKDRVKENIEGIEEWAETAQVKLELDFITGKLASFQNSRDTVSNAKGLIIACKAKLITMKDSLGIENELYINVSSAVVGNAQSMLVTSVNAAQEFRENDLYESMLRRSKLKETITEALEVSYLLQTLDMNYELEQHYERNHEALKSLARQLNVSTLSPKEKLQKEINDLENKLSNIRSKPIKSQELQNAMQQMDNIISWKLFRSRETRTLQIAEQDKVINAIKERDKKKQQTDIQVFERIIVRKRMELKNIN